MFEIMELDEELQQNRIEAGLEKEDAFTPRLAKAQKQLDESIEELHRSGITEPYDIARILGRHPSTIKARLGAIERKLEQERVSDLDIIEGSFRSQGGYLAILS
jgi:NAD/NADP transhydrogenase beta subunit